jgi:hypothetical protein
MARLAGDAEGPVGDPSRKVLPAVAWLEARWRADRHDPQAERRLWIIERRFSNRLPSDDA